MKKKLIIADVIMVLFITIMVILNSIKLDENNKNIVNKFFSANEQSGNNKFSIVADPDYQKKKPGDEAEIKVSVKNIDMGKIGINNIVGYLNYDESIFENVTITGINDWNFERNEDKNHKNFGKFVAHTMKDGITEDSEIFDMKLKIKSDILPQKTEIKFTKLVSSDGNFQTETDDITAIIEIVGKNDIIVPDQPSSENKENVTENQTSEQQISENQVLEGEKPEQRVPENLATDEKNVKNHQHFNIKTSDNIIVICCILIIAIILLNILILIKNRKKSKSKILFIGIILNIILIIIGMIILFRAVGHNKETTEKIRQLDVKEQWLNSDNYLVTDENISRITPKTKIEDMPNKFNKKIEIYNGDNLVSNGLVTSGMKVKSESETQLISVIGDLDNNGFSNNVELTQIIRNIVNKNIYSFEENEKLSADMNMDNKIDNNDVKTSIKYILYDEIESKKFEKVSPPKIDIVDGKYNNYIEGYENNVKVKISSQDKNTEKIKYKIEGQETKSYSEIENGGVIELKQNGVYKISAYSYGKLGNRSEIPYKIIVKKNPENKYRIIKYTEQSDGTYFKEEQEQNGRIGETVKVPDEIPDGYEINKDKSNTEVTVSEEKINEIVVYYDRKEFNVTLNSGENIVKVKLGNESDKTISKKYKFGKKINVSAIVDDQKGYNISFNKWICENNIINLTEKNSEFEMPKSDVVLTAKASKKIIDYNIEYELSGGNLLEGQTNPTKYTIETGDFKLNNPVKNGYVFKGWTEIVDGVETKVEGAENNLQTTVTVRKGSIGNRKYVANWEKVKYKITYNLNGGNLLEGQTNLEEYNVETETFKLNNPVKVGYTFLGWTGTGLTKQTESGEIVDNPTKEVEIRKGSTEDRAYIANWEANTGVRYKVQYYLEKLETEDEDKNNENNYELKEEVELSGTTGEGVKAEEKIYTGFTYDKENRNNKTQGNIAGDGSLVLKLYYTRNSYTIKYDKNENVEKVLQNASKYSVVEQDGNENANGNSEANQNNGSNGQTNQNEQSSSNGNEDVSGKTISYKYGENVEIEAILKQIAGYKVTFSKWESSSEEVLKQGTEASLQSKTSFKMPAENINLNAVADKEANIVNYKIEYYYAKDDTTYSETPTYIDETRQAKVDETVKVTDGDKIPNEKNPGYEFDERANNVLSVKIPAEGEAVLKIYFKKSEFKLTIIAGNGINQIKLNEQTAGAGEKIEKIFKYGSDIAIDAETVIKEGYDITFGKWKSDSSLFEETTEKAKSFKMPEGNLVLTAEANVIPLDANYKIEYYYQKDGEYPEKPDESDVTIRTGKTGEQVQITGADKEPIKDGYVYDSGYEGNIETTDKEGIRPDGSTTLKVYFKQQFTVKYNPGEHGNFEAYIVNKLDYGAKVPGYSGVFEGKDGYIFDKWSLTKIGDENISGDVEMPTEMKTNLEYTAQWKKMATPEITHTPTEWINKNVMVTITSPEQGYSIEYRVAKEDETTTEDTYIWKTYTSEFEIEENCEIYARLAVGDNKGDQVKHDITNIDKQSPKSVKKEIDTSKIDEAIININATDNLSGIIEWGIFKENWAGTKTVSVENTKEGKIKVNEIYENGTYKITLKDAAGNTSEENVEITHIQDFMVARIVSAPDEYKNLVGTEYLTLAQALEISDEAAQKGNVKIEIIHNIGNESNTIKNGRDYTINLNNLYVNNYEAKNTFIVDGKLTIVDESKTSEGKVESLFGTGIYVTKQGELTVGKDDRESPNIYSPIIEGEIYGIEKEIDNKAEKVFDEDDEKYYYPEGVFNFYDGKIIGRKGAFLLQRANDTPLMYDPTVIKNNTTGKQESTLAIVSGIEAVIGKKRYMTLEEAISDANNVIGDKDTQVQIDIVRDLAKPQKVTVDESKNIKLNLNGHTFTTTSSDEVVENHGKLEIIDSSEKVNIGKYVSGENQFSEDKTTWNDSQNGKYKITLNSGTGTLDEQGALVLDGNTTYKIDNWQEGSYGSYEIETAIDEDFKPVSASNWYRCSCILGTELPYTQKDFGIIISSDGYYSVGYDNSSIWKSSVKANDGKYHKLKLIYKANSLTFFIDDVQKGIINYDSSGDNITKLGIGWNCDSTTTAIKGKIKSISLDYNEPVTGKITSSTGNTITNEITDKQKENLVYEDVDLSNVQKNGEYYFESRAEGGLISNNGGKQSTIAQSYVEIDLTNKPGMYELDLDTQVFSSKNSGDYGFVYLRYDKDALTFDNNTLSSSNWGDSSYGNLIMINGEESKECKTDLAGGAKYYIHFIYRNRSGMKSNSDCFIIKKVKIAKIENVPVLTITNGTFENTDENINKRLCIIYNDSGIFKANGGIFNQTKYAYNKNRPIIGNWGYAEIRNGTFTNCGNYAGGINNGNKGSLKIYGGKFLSNYDSIVNYAWLECSSKNVKIDSNSSSTTRYGTGISTYLIGKTIVDDVTIRYKDNGIYSEDGNTIINNAHISNVNFGIHNIDGLITINNANISNTSNGVICRNKVIVNNITMNDGTVDVGFRTYYNWYKNLIINNADIKTKSHCILDYYYGSYSTDWSYGNNNTNLEYEINGGNFESTEGCSVYISTGTRMKINDGTFKAKGEVIEICGYHDNGYLTILGGVFESDNSTGYSIYKSAQNNSNKITLGEKDGTITKEKPVLKGTVCTFENTFNFYDGEIIAPENKVIQGTVTEIPDDTEIVRDLKDDGLEHDYLGIPTNYVAKISELDNPDVSGLNEKYYKKQDGYYYFVTLDSAVKASRKKQDNTSDEDETKYHTTIDLIDDILIYRTINIDSKQNITIKTNNKTIFGICNLLFENNGKLEIDNENIEKTENSSADETTKTQEIEETQDNEENQTAGQTKENTTTDGLVVRLDGKQNTSEGHSTTTHKWQAINNPELAGTIYYSSREVLDNELDWKDNYYNFDYRKWINLGQMNYDTITTEITFETTDVTSTQYLIGNWNAGGCGLLIQNGYIRAECYINGKWNAINSNSIIDTNRIYNAILTYDGKTMILYVNGEEQSRLNIEGTIGIPTNETSMAIGVNPSGPKNYDGNFLYGKVYNAAIYNKAISIEDVKQNSNCAINNFKVKLFGHIIQNCGNIAKNNENAKMRINYVDLKYLPLYITQNKVIIENYGNMNVNNFKFRIGKDNEQFYNGYMFYNYNNGILNIENATGYITGCSFIGNDAKDNENETKSVTVKKSNLLNNNYGTDCIKNDSTNGTILLDECTFNSRIVNNSSGNIIINNTKADRANNYSNGKIIIDGNKTSIEGVYNTSNANGIVEMNDGNITVEGIGNIGKLIINGGTVKNTSYSEYNKNAAIYNYETGTTIITGENTKIVSNATYGANGIYNANTGTVIVESGEISAIPTNTSCSGAGIDNDSSATLIIGVKDGNIKYKPTIYGKNYGIYNTGTFKFYDGILNGKYNLSIGGVIPIELEDETTRVIHKGEMTFDDGTKEKYKVADQREISVLEKVMIAEVESTGKKYTSINEAYKNCEDTDTIKIIHDASVTGDSVAIEENKNITLDLNGFTIVASNKETFVNNGIFKIVDISSHTDDDGNLVEGKIINGADTILKNNGIAEINNGSFELTLGGSNSDNYWYLFNNTGTLTINSKGKINTDELWVKLIKNSGTDSKLVINNGIYDTNWCSNNYYCGGYVIENISGNVTVNGGELYGDTSILNKEKGNVTITGGKIINRQDNGCDAIRNWSESTVTITGGTLSSAGKNIIYNGKNDTTDGNIIITGGTFNTLQGYYSPGYVVHNAGRGNVTITGGIFNTYGEVIYNSELGVINIDGTQKSEKDKIVMKSKGYAWNNYVNREDIYRAVVNNGDGIVNIKGYVDISFENANRKNVAIFNYQKGIINIGDSENITNNTCISGIYNYYGTLNYYGGKITSTEPVTGYVSKIPDGYNVIKTTGENNNIIYEIGHETQSVSVGDVVYDTLGDAINNNTEGTIKILKNIVLTTTEKQTIDENKNFVLDENGNSIEVHISDIVFMNNGTLKIIDSSEKQTGKILGYADTIIRNSGKLDIESGYIGANHKDYDELIYNTGTGILNMSGGTLYNYSSCASDCHSYAIYSKSDNDINITGGKIKSHAYTWSYTNGIYIVSEKSTLNVSDTTFEMVGTDSGRLYWIYRENGGNTNIKGNTSMNGNQNYNYNDFIYGIAYNKGQGTLNIEDNPNITSNHGIYIWANNPNSNMIINIKGGNVSNITGYNKIKNNNGKTYENIVNLIGGTIGYNGTFTEAIHGCSVNVYKDAEINTKSSGIAYCDNLNIYDGATITVPSDKSAIYFYGGTTNIYGGTINGNVEIANSGNECNFNMFGGVINGSNYGINMRLANGTAAITGGTITATNGPGIKVESGTVILGENTGGYPDISIPSVTGSTYGVQNTGGNFKFYDGILTGQTYATSGKVTETPEMFNVIYSKGGTVGYLGIEATFEQIATVNGVYYDDLPAAVTAASKVNGTIELCKDITLSDSIEIPSGASIEIDLGGFSINGYTKGESLIVNNGTLVIDDTTNEGTNESMIKNYNGPVIENNGTLTIGANDDKVYENAPRIVGKDVAIDNKGICNFFDGKIMLLDENSDLYIKNLNAEVSAKEKNVADALPNGYVLEIHEETDSDGNVTSRMLQLKEKNNS